jgi:MinD superfamily P-loop ATPase
MIISIASGKGGTGKTTIATNLALSLEEAQLIDCDVEEPNANIFLKATIKKSEDVTVEIPNVDTTLCDYCGKCSDFCSYNALATVGSKVLVFPELCHSCGGCALVCPKGAIKWKTRTIGKIEHGSVNGFDFYHGLLNVGESMAIPVLKSLKKKIDSTKNVILDAPPGTSCPMIETVNGSDYCMLVTEPTPFGLHDLKLAVNVVKHLNIPFGVIINCDGIGDNTVEHFCQKEKIPILMKIPHDKNIAELYSKGIPFVTRLAFWNAEFISLFNRIKEEVAK